ncbi:large ribosomal subunit protein mL41 [Trichomonascus vanleenenianus]|uniref:mitochondrial 54S ribosomal protein mL41 MRPL27 n=1 Tax=Trichomonascus vanleenenianus TaxID=2268995 RepID=UPI003ECA3609
MKPSPITQLLRPWQRYRNGLPFYGFGRKGNKRWPLTTKQGNKNFYKGTGSSGVGRWTTRGRYIISWEKVRTYVVPSGVSESPLKPLVCAKTTPTKNTFGGFPLGALDGKLYLQKVREYIRYGASEAPAAKKRGHVERG